MVGPTYNPPYVARDNYRFIKMLAALIIVGCCAVWTLAGVIPQGNWTLREPLRFTKDGTFQISIFEDLHFGESMIPDYPCNAVSS